MEDLRKPTPLDRVLGILQTAVLVLADAPPSRRPDPAAALRTQPESLDAAERAQSAALMRVNHVGEICAQALYEAQALLTRDAALRAVFEQAAREESDHLAWTRGRVEQLGGHVSYLSPAWFGGAFAIGALASLAGDAISLGFMSETERQVEEHLHSHLERLPAGDRVSRAIVEQMKADEAAHGSTARAHGGVELPWPVRQGMRLAARVMTTTAHYV